MGEQVYAFLMVLLLFDIEESVQCLPSKQPNVIDLTHPVDENTLAWPASLSTFSVDQQFSGLVDEKGFWYTSRDFSSPEHAGTHVDAPNHLRDASGGWSTDNIPIDRLIGQGIKIDISRQCAQNIDYLLSVDDLVAWENEHGKVPVGAIVIVHTGRGHLYATDRQRYLGRPIDMDLPDNDVEHLHFPGVGVSAAEWLAHRQVKGVGIDTPSLDNGPSGDYLAHRILLGSNIWGLENVANSELLPSTGFTVYNMVYYLKGGSGGPTRAIAVLDK